MTSYLREATSEPGRGHSSVLEDDEAEDGEEDLAAASKLHDADELKGPLIRDSRACWVQGSGQLASSEGRACGGGTERGDRSMSLCRGRESAPGGGPTDRPEVDKPLHPCFLGGAGDPSHHCCTSSSPAQGHGAE